MSSQALYVILLFAIFCTECQACRQQRRIADALERLAPMKPPGVYEAP